MTDLTVDEVARILKRHPENVRELLRDRRLRGRKVGSERGGTWQVPEAELRHFCELEGTYRASHTATRAGSTPWDAAGVSLQTWRRAFERSEREMAGAVQRQRSWLDSDPHSVGEWRQVSRKVRVAHERHLRLLDGDRATILRLAMRRRGRTKR